MSTSYGGIQLHSQLFLWVFYNEVGFQKSRAYLVGLPVYRVGLWAM